MKYQTNAVGHRVGASELPTRHPRHKPGAAFPFSSSLVVASYSKISPCSFSFSLFPSLFYLLGFFFFVFFFFNVLHFFAASIYIFLFLFFSSLSHRAISPHFFLMFSSLCLKITSLKTPGYISVTSRILVNRIVDFIVVRKSCPNNI